MTKIKNGRSKNKADIHTLKLNEYCSDKIIPLTIQSRVISGNTDTIHWGSYIHSWHTHSDFAELVIVVSGSAINNFPNGQTVLMQAGDIMLMAPGSMHHYTGASQVKYFNLLFDTKLLERIPGFLSQMPNYRLLWQAPDKIPMLFHLEGKAFTAAASLLEDMLQEELDHLPGHEEVLFANFCLFLVHILRHTTNANTDSRRNATDFHIAQIIFYMNNNSSKDLSIDDLSKQAFMSESNFRRRFKEVTGLPPANYLLRIRLQKAALLLIHTNFQIEQIAFDCGFTEGNYFTRKFRETFCMTPRDFRRKCTTGELNINEEIKKLAINSP